MLKWKGISGIEITEEKDKFRQVQGKLTPTNFQSLSRSARTIQLMETKTKDPPLTAFLKPMTFARLSLHGKMLKP